MKQSMQKISAYLISSCLASLLGLASTAANTAIFQCVDAKGNSNFQDKPCQKEDTSEIVALAKSSSPMPPSSPSDKTEMKMLKQQRTINSKRHKTLAKLERQENRLKVRSYQRDRKLQEKAEKKLVRCQQIQEKIAFIESQLRHGSKFKSYYRLNEELERYQKMKNRYCQTS